MQLCIIKFIKPEIIKLIIIDGPVKFYSGEMADSLANVVGVKTMKNVIVPSTIKEFEE